MTIIELKNEQKVLNEKIAVLIKEFEGKCKGAVVDYINIERFNSFTPGNDVIIINTDVALGKV